MGNGKNSRNAITFAQPLLFCLLFYVGSAPAQQLVMQSPADLPGTSVRPQVIGATPADPKVWPATFVFRNSQGAGCTATAVGARVILTAAHCLENSSTGIVKINGRDITVNCEYHPNYPTDIGADFALCQTNNDLPVPDMGFETVDVNSQRPAQNENVTLLGYGCLTASGQDHNFGSLFYGDARVTQIRDKYGFVQTRGGSAVCFGDSGGGAYFALNATGTIRRLFAVNARGDIAQISWLTPTASQTFFSWAQAWTAPRKVSICGIGQDTSNCRQ
jgi:hypothetical protein